MTYQVPDDDLQSFHCVLHLLWGPLNLDLILTLCKLDVNFREVLGYLSDISTLFSDHITMQPSRSIYFCKDYTVCLIKKKKKNYEN